MNAYEQIISTIREQSRTTNPSVPRLAVMKTATKCDIGDLVLDPDDYLISDRLKGKLKAGDVVLIQKISDEQYAIITRLEEGE